MPRTDHTRLWIRSTQILTGADAEVRAGLVGMRAGVLTDVLWGEAARDWSLPHGEDVLDVGDDLVTPAFVNGHTHLPLTFMRGMQLEKAARGNVVEDLFFALEAKLHAEDIRAFTRMGALASLLSGVGHVWEHYYFADAVAAGMTDVGLSGVVGPTLQDLSGPGVPWLDGQWAATDALREEHWARRGIAVAVAPHATDTVSDALWQRAADYAAAHALPLHAHLGQSPDEAERIFARAGKSPTALLADLGVLDTAPYAMFAHGIFVDDADLARLDGARHSLVVCPYSATIFGYPSQVQRWHAAGIAPVVATDAAVSNDSWNVQKELRAVAGLRTHAMTWDSAYTGYLEKGSAAGARAAWAARAAHYDAGAALQDPAFLLRTVWDTPGSRHPQQRVGQLVAGALANVLVWNTKHPSMWPRGDAKRALAYGDTTAAIRAMWVAGRQVGDLQRGPQALLDHPAFAGWQREADARLKELKARALG